MDINANAKTSKCLPEYLKNLSITTWICLIIFPIVFITIGWVYRKSCSDKPDLAIFLIIFGILILVNVLIYSILGTTFLALIRRMQSCSFPICLGSFIGIVFGIVIFIWWIIGTIWWIKLTLKINPQLTRPTSKALCHPVIYWTVLIANLFGLIGFLKEICMAIGLEGRRTNK